MCTLYNLCKHKDTIKHTTCITLETDKLGRKNIKETTQKSAREEVQYNGHCMIKHDQDVGNNATCLHHSTCCK